MKVVIVSKALVVGAYQRKLEEIAAHHDVELVAVVPPGWREGAAGAVTMLERAHTKGYELIVAPIRFNGQFHLHYYPTLGRLLAQIKPDILHMDEEPYNLATWLALRSASRLGIPALFFTWQNLLRTYPWPFRKFERANYARAAHALAGNPTAAGVLRQKGYGGPTSIVPQFGVDPETFAPRADAFGAERIGAERIGRAQRDVVIGYAGRLVPEKGIDLLLRACARLSTGGWTLRILGDGDERERLAHLAGELGIGQRVEFIGRIPSTQAPAFYRQLDMLVLPSVSRANWVEQFGRVLTEAMACGVPVIGSDSGEIPWVIGDAGVIFPEGDVPALAAALQGLIDDVPGRLALAERGRARVLSHFTMAQIAAATVAVYRQAGAAHAETHPPPA